MLMTTTALVDGDTRIETELAGGDIPLIELTNRHHLGHHFTIQVSRLTMAPAEQVEFLRELAHAASALARRVEMREAGSHPERATP